MRRFPTGKWTRREFLGTAALAGTGALIGLKHPALASEPPPETRRIRLLQVSTKTACWAPQYVAEPLLREEGFTDIQYVPVENKEYRETLKSGRIDMNVIFSARHLVEMDETELPTVFISGLHAGCYYLIGSERVQSVTDLKGKTVWAGGFKGGGPHVFFMTIVSYVGLDPYKDVNYAWVPMADAYRMFSEGKIDALISFPPEPQKLIENNIGHVILDTNVDKPWSQYFCCMLTGNREFIRNNPVATKRALRAILKATDITGQNPELATRVLIEKNVRRQEEYKYIYAALRDIPWEKWRDYHPEDTLRFYSLRLHDIGMTSSNPKEFIEKNTDWSFIKELKQELKMTWV